MSVTPHGQTSQQDLTVFEIREWGQEVRLVATKAQVVRFS